jgi:hypothetical protein
VLGEVEAERRARRERLLRIRAQLDGKIEDRIGFRRRLFNTR